MPANQTAYPVIRPKPADVRAARRLLANGPTFYADNADQWPELVSCAWAVLHLDRAASRCATAQALFARPEGGAA